LFQMEKKYSGNIFSSELFFMEYFFHIHYNYSTCKENLYCKLMNITFILDNRVICFPLLISVYIKQVFYLVIIKIYKERLLWMRCVYLYTIPVCTDMEAEEYEKIFTFINDGTYIEGKKLFNSVVFQSWMSLL
jgi:hypothetical protein